MCTKGTFIGWCCRFSLNEIMVILKKPGGCNNNISLKGNSDFNGALVSFVSCLVMKQIMQTTLIGKPRQIKHGL